MRRSGASRGRSQDSRKKKNVCYLVIDCKGKGNYSKSFCENVGKGKIVVQQCVNEKEITSKLFWQHEGKVSKLFDNVKGKVSKLFDNIQ